MKYIACILCLYIIYSGTVYGISIQGPWTGFLNDMSSQLDQMNAQISNFNNTINTLNQRFENYKEKINKLTDSWQVTAYEGELTIPYPTSKYINIVKMNNLLFSIELQNTNKYNMETKINESTAIGTGGLSAISRNYQDDILKSFGCGVDLFGFHSCMKDFFYINPLETMQQLTSNHQTFGCSPIDVRWASNAYSYMGCYNESTTTFIDIVNIVGSDIQTHYNVLPDKHQQRVFGASVTTEDNTVIYYGGAFHNNTGHTGSVSIVKMPSMEASIGFPHTPRWFHSAILYKNKYMYVYGGMDGTQVLNDLSMYDIERDFWKVLNPNALPEGAKRTQLILLEDTLLFFYGVKASEEQLDFVGDVPRAMTTAHRAQFNPAMGSENQGYIRWTPSMMVSVLQLPSHKKLKTRQLGQDSKEDLATKDFKEDLLKREETHRKEQEQKRNLAIGHKVSSDLTGATEIDETSVRSNINTTVDTIEADNEDEHEFLSDGESESESDMSDSEEDEAELLRQLEKMREEERVQKALAEESQQKEDEEAILEGNTLLQRKFDQEGPTFAVKRKWHDTTVFRNQAASQAKPKKRRYVNDTLRNDMQREFMRRFVQ